jgi:hypothetical protein
MRNELYEWDEDKNQINIKKHGVSFEEAWTVFNDENHLYEIDDEHSFNEERFVIIGMSEHSKLLYVCHCYRENGDVIRLISARKAEKGEIEAYYGGIYEAIF